MRTKLLFIFYAAFFSLQAMAVCNLPPESPWFWTDKALIDRTPTLILARVVGIREHDSEFADYDFKVVNLIKHSSNFKTKQGQIFTLRNFAWPSFKVPNQKGRAVRGIDCRLLVGFQKDQNYLIFLDAFHPKGYERIKDPRRDDWYSFVLRSVPRTSTKEEN